VQDRLREKWQERFVDAITTFYFECKQHGVVPRYDQLTESEQAAREKQVREVTIQRKLNVERVKEAQAHNENCSDEVYRGDLPSKLIRANQNVLRGHHRQEKVHERQHLDLLDRCKERHAIQEMRMDQRVRDQERERQAKLHALRVEVNSRNAALIVMRTSGKD
jgi:hypothetical protein